MTPTENILPMLAATYDGDMRRFPVDVQPKLDGLRCVVQCEGGEITITSRNGKPFVLDHIEAALSGMPGEWVVDGEMYRAGLSCQQIASLVKRPRAETATLQFHVFDIPVAATTWEQRREWLEDWGRYLDPEAPVVIVPTRQAMSDAEIDDLHDEFVAQGYEGAIIRTLDGEYAFGKRSRELLKYKCFDDHEFKVVDADCAEGKHAGCVIWICVTETGRRFRAVPDGTVAERQGLWTNRACYVGLLLTVTHLGTTDDGIPRHPIARQFRDYE